VPAPPAPLSSPVRLEVACFDHASALAAARAGADRLELCVGAREGGLTPSRALVEAVREAVAVPLAVMVRTRGGDFCFSGDEHALMRRDLRQLREAGADAFVWGALLPSGEIDTAALHAFVEAADGTSVAFHRAFDAAPDPFAALDTLADAGVVRVLSAGGLGTAAEGASRLAALVRHAAGRLVVMPGGGVRASNVRALVAETWATDVHSAARRRAAPGHPHGDMRDEADPAEVAALVAALR